jgi:excinuclease ABC subunit A
VLSGPSHRVAKKPAARTRKKATSADRQEQRAIAIRGARQNNLKSVDVDIPRHAFTVCSGPSGSGKSSLALETLYAEGQRRYVESLSSYARQFLAPLQKPKVDHISGLAPAIAIEQKTTSRSPRSTVGTVTEIHDYLRILYARLGHPHCPGCGQPIGTQSSDEIVEKILHEPEGSRIAIMAPVERPEGEDFAVLWDDLRAAGFARVRVDGVSCSLDSPPELSSRRKHQVEVIVDRAIVRRATRSRLADSVESALDLGKGVVHVARMGPKDEADDEGKWHVIRFSQHLSCDRCHRSFEVLSPNHFSFNGALGWCPSCQGLGVQSGANPAVLIPDGRRSIRGGAVASWPDFASNPDFARMIQALADGAGGLDLDTPFDELEPRHRRLILHGGGDQRFQVPAAGADRPGFSFQFKGLFPALEEASRLSFLYRMKLQGLVDEVECATCMGSRLRDDAAAVRFHGFTIDQVSRWPLRRTAEFFDGLKLTTDQKHIAGDLIREIRDRLHFLNDVGLDYLTLGRSTPTLSGGEAQRIRLASQLGSGLTGVLYVLDEPTIGLHPRDNTRLLGALRRLRDLGNTLVVVEHDREVIEAADFLVDFGPESGSRGGEITAAGAPKRVKKVDASLTGRYLAGKEAIAVPTNRRPIDGAALVVKGARHHNLKSVDARFPLGVVTVVTGVSGSGKSSLVEDILGNAAARILHRASTIPGAHDGIEGLARVDKVIRVDQSPIGTTPASNPATYTGLFDAIRDLYAKLPESKVRGYTAGRFSFNVAGGRCETCQGEGQKRIEMHFLPDVWVTCETCNGARYTLETLGVTYRGRSIADVLAMTVDEALDLFAGVPKLRKILQTLHDVGLGYVALGQSAPTMSGGEAQRVKLAAELARPDTGRTLYLLDEPTTGLHLSDIQKLLSVLHRLADLGNTVVVIEHNLEVVKTADNVLDMGPEAGEAGGRIVASGTPEEVAACVDSLTGRILLGVLKAGPHAERPSYDPRASALRDLEEARRVAKAELNGASRLPWEIDGPAWHCRDRVGRSGRPARWDGSILETVINQIGSLGGLPEPDWSRRTQVRVASPDPEQPPFFEAQTGHEWILTLTFRVQPGTFVRDVLARSLNLVPFAEGARPVLSDAPRLRLTTLRGAVAGQEVEITCHDRAELESDAFRTFLSRAVERAIGREPIAPVEPPGWKVVAPPAPRPSRGKKKADTTDHKAS